MMYLFLFMGVLALLAPFLSTDLKSYSRKSQLVVFGIFFLVGGVFTYVGVKNLYEDFFREYPSMEIRKYSDECFDEYNSIKTSYEGQEVIEIEKEHSCEHCDGDYCWQVSNKRLFTGADLDSNKMVTKQELYNLIKTFDTNHDGLINFSEAGIKTIFKTRKESEVEILNDAYPTHSGKRWKK